MVLGEALPTRENLVKDGQRQVSRGKHVEDPTITQMYQAMINYNPLKRRAFEFLFQSQLSLTTSE